MDDQISRCFVAVDISPTVKRLLSDEINFLQLAGADVRWTPKSNMHLTLQFLGSVGNSEIMNVIAAIRRATAEILVCQPTVAGVECIPAIGNPRVLAAGLCGETDPLHQLVDALQKELRPLGFRPEPRRKQFHVTLGRVKGARGMDDLKQRLSESSTRTFGTTDVESIYLMMSDPKASGPVYSIMEEFPLNPE